MVAKVSKVYLTALGNARDGTNGSGMQMTSKVYRCRTLLTLQTHTLWWLTHIYTHPPLPLTKCTLLVFSSEKCWVFKVFTWTCSPSGNACKEWARGGASCAMSSEWRGGAANPNVWHSLGERCILLILLLLINCGVVAARQVFVGLLAKSVCAKYYAKSRVSSQGDCGCHKQSQKKTRKKNLRRAVKWRTRWCNAYVNMNEWICR